MVFNRIFGRIFGSKTHTKSKDLATIEKSSYLIVMNHDADSALIFLGDWEYDFRIQPSYRVQEQSKNNAASVLTAIGIR